MRSTTPWLLLADPGASKRRRALTRAAEAPGVDRAPVLDTLGRVLLARGRCPAAAEAFARALEEDPLPDRLRAALESGLDVARACSARP
jgi:uncharacterized protein HemY